MWAPEHGSLTQLAVAEAFGLGLRVLPWTVNRPADLRRMIRWGIVGLITDRPDIAIQILSAADIDFSLRR